MLLGILAAAYAAGAVGLADDFSAARNREWQVGDERELTAGSFTRLYDEFQGWRIWRGESRYGVSCAAVKPAQGQPHPKPFNVKSYFGSQPALQVMIEEPFSRPKRLDWRIVGQWPNPSTQEYRLIGERFYNARPDIFAPEAAWQELLSRDGTMIEVHVVSWRYPSIYEGRSEATGVIDLGGLDAAIQAVETCNRS